MKELAYALINPYTMYKSRTGGVISRLLSRSADLDLIGAGMFMPSKELVEEYVEALALERGNSPEARKVNAHVCDYVRTNYMPGPGDQRKRVMFLLVEGENAVELLRDEVVGSVIRQTVGETIRDTYGDFIEDASGDVVYFEPAVLIAASPESASRHIDIWLRHSDTDSGILSRVVPYPEGAEVESTLVMIKPDSLAESRTRTGAVIDLFSKTGLHIVAIKVIHLTVAQAMEFYKPVREIFVEKFVGRVRDRACDALADAFDFPIPPETIDQVAEQLKAPNADHEFGKIVRFMTGRDPWNVPREQWASAGEETCIALVYQGENAIEKIREQLGSTDPSQAAPATVRKEFGRDIMVNTAHASDSTENAAREIRILDIAANDLPALVAERRAAGQTEQNGRRETKTE